MKDKKKGGKEKNKKRERLQYKQEKRLMFLGLARRLKNGACTAMRIFGRNVQFRETDRNGRKKKRDMC